MDFKRIIYKKELHFAQRIYVYTSIFKKSKSLVKVFFQYICIEEFKAVMHVCTCIKFPFQRRNRAICCGIMQTPEHQEVGFR